MESGMNKLYDEMVFSINSYNNKDEMWRDISSFIQLLVKNDYIAVIRDDDVDIIVVEFGHDENKEYWGCPRVEWVEDEDSVVNTCCDCEECRL